MSEKQVSQSSSKLIVTGIAESTVKAGVMQAELRQEITTITSYPSKQRSTDLQDNIFSSEEFGDKMQDFTHTEKRVAWMDVPTGLTPEDVSAKLAQAPNARLYKVLSNYPILSDAQNWAVDNGKRTIEDFANRQVVRRKNPTTDVMEITLDTNGKVQYRAVFFSSVGKADEDFRTSVFTEQYVSPAIQEELANGSNVPA